MRDNMNYLLYKSYATERGTVAESAVECQIVKYFRQILIN